MSNNKPKLELTWIGKDEQPSLEPRILIEDTTKSYGIKNAENLLIHGDNLLALKALEQDYAGKVKCIYIDPPYNTGNAFEHYDDGLEHSIWLSLMKTRLELLRRLLSEDGSIWISIDDNECHYLKILCDEVFGRNNFIANLPTIMNLKGNPDQFGFAGTHEYLIVYAKDKNICNFNKFEVDEDELLKEWDEDQYGLYKKADTLRRTGQDAAREKRPKGYFPIFITSDEKIYVTDDDNPINSKDYILLPINDKGDELSWTWSKDKIGKDVHNLILTKTRTGDYNIYKKQRPDLSGLPSKKPKSIFYKPEYNSGNGTAQIKALFGIKNFDYPKPEHLISDIILLASSQNDLILDSFLGSGTTAAVAHKMGRRWIGIELGEHCTTHCLPRLKKVVDGTDQGGISKAVNWQGGGGFKFYELAPSLLKKDAYDNWVIDDCYNADMLAAAMAKHEGFHYAPDKTIYWKQGQSTEKDFIYTTTQLLTMALLERIAGEMKPDESLLICCRSYQKACESVYPNITIKKIPHMLLGRCEFGKEDYSLNIINMPEVNSDEDSIPDDNMLDDNDNWNEVMNEDAGNIKQSTLFDFDIELESES